MKPATSDLACSWGLPPSSNPTRSKSGCGPGLRELPEIRASPLIFLQRLKLATSNLVHSLSLPRHIIKSHAERKAGRGPGLKELPKIWSFPSIFTQSLFDTS